MDTILYLILLIFSLYLTIHYKDKISSRYPIFDDIAGFIIFLFMSVFAIWLLITKGDKDIIEKFLFMD